MSLSLMVAAFDQKVGDASKKLILLKLADQANDDGFCWPSYATLAKQCEVSKRTAQRKIIELENEGYLTRVARSNHKGHQSNYYYLHFGGVGSRPPADAVLRKNSENPAAESEPEPAQTGIVDNSTPYSHGDAPPIVTVTPPYSHGDTTLWSQCHPESLNDPLIDPKEKEKAPATKTPLVKKQPVTQPTVSAPDLLMGRDAAAVDARVCKDHNTQGEHYQAAKAMIKKALGKKGKPDEAA